MRELRIMPVEKMPVLRGWWVILLFFLFPLSGFAQPGGEAGVMGGGAYYLGEYNPSRHFKNVGIYYGAFYRYNLNDRFAFRLNLGMTKLEYTNERLLSVGVDRYPLSFKADVKDIAGVVEFNFRSFMIPKTDETSLWSPYLFAGVGYLTAGKEGTLTIPAGLGIKFNLFYNLGLGVEWGVRKTFSDRLDGLEDPWKTGESNMIYSKDWVFVTGITLSYRFPYDPECHGYK